MKLPLWIYKILGIPRYFVLTMNKYGCYSADAIRNLSYDEAYRIVSNNPRGNIYEDIVQHIF